MDVNEPPKSFAKRLQQRLAASRFFTFSLLIHVVIVVMAGSIVLIKTATDAPDFEASEGGLVSGETVAAPPADPTPDLTQTFTPDTPQVNAPQINTLTTTNMQTPTFSVQASAPAIKPVQTDAMSKALENASKSMAKGAGVGNIPGTMAGRMGGTSRQRMMDMKRRQKEERGSGAARAALAGENSKRRWLMGRRLQVGDDGAGAAVFPRSRGDADFAGVWQDGGKGRGLDHQERHRPAGALECFHDVQSTRRL